MARKKAVPSVRQGNLYLEVQDQDWGAITGTPDDLAQLGQLLIEFARSGEGNRAILDSPSPRFRKGSLGIYLYRTAGT